LRLEEGPAVVYEAFEAGSHLAGVVGILDSLGWDNFRYDPDLTRRSLTAPGVTAIVAVARDAGDAGDAGEVVGFAQVFSDGVFQAHLGLLAVDEGWHRRGVGRGLVEEAFVRVGAERMDLIASDESLAFYRSLKHREQVGFRIYSDRETE
jgi:ribosomal protein S18 acetylase RimI-like enzyme